MKKKCLILYKAIIVAIFIGITCVANAQQSLSAEEYSQAVWKLADELKTKLEKIERSNDVDIMVNRLPREEEVSKRKLWAAAHYALEDLKNVRYFYLHPNVLPLGWERPSSDSHQTLTKIIVKDGKSFYIEGTLPGLHSSKYRETTAISFYDPSGRKIQCCGIILPFDQLKELIKTSQIKVVSKRGSKPFLDMTGSSTNGGMGAAYVDVADSWLLKSSYTNEVVNLPFGTFWTSTPNDGGLKCITVDVYATHAYEETSLNKSDEALCLYAFEIDYTQLLNWYKESLDYLMRDVNKLLGEQEAKEKAKEDAFDEADKKEPLASLLIETASKLSSDKSLFDFIVMDKLSNYEINVIANSNTVRLTKDFWKRLQSLENKHGNICLYYIGSPTSNYKYDIASTEKENRLHIKSLVNSIQESSNNNILAFIKRMFRYNVSVADRIKEGNSFDIHVPITDGSYGIKIPCLTPSLSKGDVIYTITLPKSEFNLQSNNKGNGFSVKFK